MLNDVERAALRRWYARDEIIERAKRLHDDGLMEELEELLHRSGLFPLANHAALPDYMRTEDGGPLFPTNLNPMQDEERWQDAIEIGWEVVQEKLGFSHDDIHRAIAKEQNEDWEAWMKDVERRKREREAEGS